jgi:uncharacterized protein YsxB (DUF464 family)
LFKNTYVNPLPVCNITGNNTVCSGVSTLSSLQVNFLFMVGPSGFTANTASTGNITAAGAYNVTVTDANGCTSSCSRTLTVNPLPVCNITGNNTVCSGVSTLSSLQVELLIHGRDLLALLLTLLQQETLLRRCL